MSDIQSLIQQLQSDNSNKRYDACEELRVMVLHEPLPQEAIDALHNATNDSNPDVADAAQRALMLHTQTLTPDITQDETITNKVKNSPKINFAIGFFSWLVIWNLLGPVAYFFIYVVVILELIGLVLPFALGKKWIGLGVVSYIITNTIVISVIAGEFTLYGLIIPFTTIFFSQ